MFSAKYSAHLLSSIYLGGLSGTIPYTAIILTTITCRRRTAILHPLGWARLVLTRSHRSVHVVAAGGGASGGGGVTLCRCRPHFLFYIAQVPGINQKFLVAKSRCAASRPLLPLFFFSSRPGAFLWSNARCVIHGEHFLFLVAALPHPMQQLAKTAWMLTASLSTRVSAYIGLV